MVATFRVFSLFSRVSRVFSCFLAHFQAAPLITLSQKRQKVTFCHLLTVLITFCQKVRVGPPELYARSRAFPEKSTL